MSDLEYIVAGLSVLSIQENLGKSREIMGHHVKLCEIWGSDVPKNKEILRYSYVIPNTTGYKNITGFVALYWKRKLQGIKEKLQKTYEQLCEATWGGNLNE